MELRALDGVECIVFIDGERHIECVGLIVLSVYRQHHVRGRQVAGARPGLIGEGPRGKVVMGKLVHVRAIGSERCKAIAADEQGAEGKASNHHRLLKSSRNRI